MLKPFDNNVSAVILGGGLSGLAAGYAQRREAPGIAMSRDIIKKLHGSSRPNANRAKPPHL